MSLIRFLASNDPFEVYKGIASFHNGKHNKKPIKIEEPSTNILTEGIDISDSNELELWSTWQDETKEAQKVTILLKDLKIKELKELWQPRTYYGPKCYVIKRY